MSKIIYLLVIFLITINSNAEILIVDFDESMGIENKARYNVMLKEEGAKEELDFFRNLWNKNNPKKRAQNNGKKIPKIFHQIWIGSKPLPRLYQKYRNVCMALHPEWEFKLWTNKDVENLEFEHKELFKKTKNIQSQSDILRYAVLQKFGGVYQDIDVLCLEPLDELTEKYSFFAGLEPPLSYNRPMISSAHIGTYKGNKLFEKTLNLMKLDQKTLDAPLNNEKMKPLTKIFLKETNLHNNSVILPATYFIPIFPPTSKLHYSLKDNLRIFFDKKIDKLLFRIIKPESLTHHEFDD